MKLQGISNIALDRDEVPELKVGRLDYRSPKELVTEGAEVPGMHGNPNLEQRQSGRLRKCLIQVRKCGFREPQRFSVSSDLYPGC